MVALGEKLGGEPADRSVGVLGIVLGALFLGSSRVCPILLTASEGLPHTGTAHRKRMSGVCGLTSEAYMSCVLGFLLLGVR
jgi:hypothetical protein